MRVVNNKRADVFTTRCEVVDAAQGIVSETVNRQSTGLVSTVITGSGRIGAIGFFEGDVVRQVGIFSLVAGVTVTHGQIAICDRNSVVLATTADQTTAFQTTGWIVLPLTSTFTAPADDAYYLACGNAGTTGCGLGVIANGATALQNTFTGYPSFRTAGSFTYTTFVPVGSSLTSVVDYTSIPAGVALV